MEDYDDKVILWKTKKMLKELGNSRDNGTSMISLIIPPKEQVSKVMQMLLKGHGHGKSLIAAVGMYPLNA